jgi:2-haloacid dehalogenase
MPVFNHQENKMKQIKSVVFDLYGTLYDVHSVAATCDEFFPGRGLEISKVWRQKQLEYTWLRSLMGLYVNFEQATEDAIRFACAELNLSLTSELQERMCNAYLRISPYPDTADALRALNEAEVPLAILSNGSRRSIQQVVNNSGLNWAFDQLISVEELAVFKPHPSVYSLAEQRMNLRRENILFVSSNAWDASAAKHFGFPTCWINRKNGAFDELGSTPTHTVSNLSVMAEWVLGQLHREVV